MRTEKKTFIVSIYRSDENNPNKLIGTVEDASAENERRAFHTVGEMVSLITGKADDGGKKGKNRRRKEDKMTQSTNKHNQ